jgi:hypothetical protein
MILPLDEWTIPGRPEDWPSARAFDPEEGRQLARWLRSAAGSWANNGRADRVAQDEALADAVLAEVEAVENEDADAWLDAVGAQMQAVRGVI